MDKATLVKSDLEIGGRVLQALSRARIPVTLCDWNYVPQLEEWQLVLATPWYDTKGPRGAYLSVIRTLEKAGIYQDVPMRRLFLKSPEDPLVKALEREVKVLTEGTIHIVSVARNRYSAIFAPFAGPVGPVPATYLAGIGELRDFLENRLHIQKSSVDDALAELSRKRSASIFNVQLTKRDARKLGLG